MSFSEIAQPPRWTQNNQQQRQEKSMRNFCVPDETLRPSEKRARKDVEKKMELQRNHMMNDSVERLRSTLKSRGVPEKCPSIGKQFVKMILPTRSSDPISVEIIDLEGGSFIFIVYFHAQALETILVGKSPCTLMPQRTDYPDDFDFYRYIRDQRAYLFEKKNGEYVDHRSIANEDIEVLMKKSEVEASKNTRKTERKRRS
ncbi:hypothetical protein PROFUN_07129 [Planoprotostelium fungivorum]|uniref:Uncharacterized protein n=1 Tax=Planoprotostelium fungivorum TaxID=1890364 RepID=A0A2P6NMN5_9EUKA|nr:hypothetical protein PROFUN_07129 [Planoprotostelium fungivorum]